MLILFIFILVFACGFVLSWWVITLIAFGGAFWLAHSGRQAFWSTFIAIFIAWVLLAMLKSSPNQHVLATQVARLFSLPHWTAIMAITGMIGGIAGGFAGLTGYYFKRVFNYTGTE